METAQENTFSIDGHEFYFINEPDLCKNTKIGIFEHIRGLSIEIAAKTKDAKILRKNNVLDRYNTKGVVTLRFELEDIFRNDGIDRKFEVESNTILHSSYLTTYWDGLCYGEFFGVVKIKRNLIQIIGNWEGDKIFPINIQLYYDEDTLDWSKYIFTTEEELIVAPSEKVHRIDFKNGLTRFPETFERFVNLEMLYIGSYYNQDTQYNLELIPQWINKFKNLNTLVVSSANLETLPDQIGELAQLTHLHIDAPIKQIPDGIVRLPRLEILTLSYCNLELIPEQVDLPKLTSLNLKNNQLKTLPVAIFNQPCLKFLNLEDNPWEYLSPEFEKIPNLELELDYKIKFFDYDYKGADGLGTITWDDDVFYASGDSALMKSISDYWKNALPRKFQDDLTVLLKKALGFDFISKEDYQEVGNHRFGGLPDLPKDWEYPRFGENWREGKESNCYEFIGQINCAKVSHLQDYLPKSGMLYFFLSTIHEVYGGSNAAKVLFFDGDIKHLGSATKWNFTEEDYFETTSDIPYEGYKVNPYTFADLPDFYAVTSNKYILKNSTEGFKNALLEDDLGYEINELFEPFQKQDIAINSYGFSQHEYPEHVAAIGQRGNPMDWIILLKVPAVKDFHFGDAGDLFFLIHKSDLAKRNFNNVFCTMYSS
ncbi:DUF1963 domain-containing protein [Belliella kenyensis]|uniref:DUF1963 domain-containing protein n=1 Tax=Belliella kenyensis TaxID=1472724 RepID=A0ABV8EMA5_9BACT|nr:DUF1963 domain-containing protein [Belliella kenyensis]MCH7403343.1 DUF1963 domain-containing protein [Belliella kenyensis]MDN3602984.1 DUF1963 domain-containing protein [Belliella kenyensis]